MLKNDVISQFGAILIVGWFSLVNWQVVSGELMRVYENNPFFNGEFQPGINLPQGPVNDEKPDWSVPNVNYIPKPTSVPTKPPDVTEAPPNNDLYKYCLQPRGTFQSRYCNAFVNCWDGNAVEQFCGKTLVFNPKGYCDYRWNVNCYGKPIKEIGDAINGGSNGWPTDGSYLPPLTPVEPILPARPVVQPPYRPPVTVGPPITIEPPGFPGGIQDPIYRPPPPPIYYPKPDPPITIEPPGFPGGIQSPVIPIHPPHHTTTTTPAPIPIVPVHLPPHNELHKYCLHPRGQFAGPNCHTFINCWDDVAIEQACPLGLHFNPSKHYCDFPFNVPCAHPKGFSSFDHHLSNNGPNKFSDTISNDLNY